MIQSRRYILKWAIFATGLAGIVAEYAMSTLASYLLGNAVFQWSMVISMMLFSMGLGSRWTRKFDSRLLECLVLVELSLTLVTAWAVPTSYFLSVWVETLEFIIYGFAILIGFLIGMEIPLVTRLNTQFEELKENISSVMEFDYFGALLGGLFFAWVGLPRIGLAKTPLILATINFLVACLLIYQFRNQFVWRKRLFSITALVGTILVISFFFVKPIVTFGEQARFRDKVIYSESTSYQKIIITRWKDDFWLYLNNSQQFSTLDEHLYHEPMVHPAMMIQGKPQSILVLGGGDGLAIREVLKHNAVERIIVVDMDPAVTRLAKNHPVFLRANGDSLNSDKVTIYNQDAFQFLIHDSELYDVIFVDLPDPRSSDLARLYSLEFYMLAQKHLKAGGVLVTQATSPFFAPKAFSCILQTISQAGFEAIAFRNHVPTMGDWGWVLGQKDPIAFPLKENLLKLNYSKIQTQFLNQEANLHIFSFGKEGIDPNVETNTLNNLILAQYYRQGRWDVY